MPIQKNESRTQAQRDALNKYQKKKYVVCAAKLKKEDAESFRAALERNGQTINSYLTVCALDYIAAHAAPDQQQTPPKEE